MKLYKKNNKIYVDILHKGKRVRKSLGIEWSKDNIKIAELKLVPKLLKDLEIDTNYTLKDMLDKYLTQHKEFVRKSTNISLNSNRSVIKEYLDDKLITSYTPNDFQVMADKMYKAGYASGSIKNVLSLVSRVFDLAIKMSVITFNPVFKVRVKTRKVIQRVVYSKDECKLLLDSAKGNLKTFLYIAIYTGARAGEILALTKSDIQGNYIIVNKSLSAITNEITPTKTSKNRKIYITNELKEYLDSLSDRLFTKSYHYTTLKYNFINLCKSLNLAYAGLHSLRHTYASLLLNDRVDPLVIKESLGHSDLKMLENIYGHFTGFREVDEKSIQNSLKF